MRTSRAATSGSKNIGRACIVLIVGWLGYRALLFINPDLGVFALFALADLGLSTAVAAWFAVAAIRTRERFRWIAYAYLALLITALVWAAIDM